MWYKTGIAIKQLLILQSIIDATITSWYGADNAFLDTSVNINFDNIDISEIKSVKFSLYNDEVLLGTKVSTGSNLVTLLKDSAQYWGQTEATYKNVKGLRILSSAFKTSDKVVDGYWVTCFNCNKYSCS